MTRRMTTIVPILCLSGVTAFAQAPWPEPGVRITRQDCQRLVSHIARPDVAYRPDVDVRGEPVASANLERRPPIELPEVFDIFISVDLCKRVDPVTGKRLCRTVVPTAGGPVEKKRYQTDALIGVATVADGGRRVYFNGQPLSDEEAAIVRESCRRRLEDHFSRR